MSLCVDANFALHFRKAMVNIHKGIGRLAQVVTRSDKVIVMGDSSRKRRIPFSLPKVICATAGSWRMVTIRCSGRIERVIAEV